MNICTTPAVYIPGYNCNDCTSLMTRVEKLENLLSGLERKALVKTDTATGTETYIGLFERTS